MEPWHIILLIVAVVLVGWIWFRNRKLVATSTAVNKNLLGSIPGYGQAVKVLSLVEKPAAKIFNTVDNTVTSALQHVPIIGNVLAMPTKIAGTVVNDTLHFLGF